MRMSSQKEHNRPRGWAIVTGASSGLGRKFSLALAERGHPVLAAARRGERLSALADEVQLRGQRLEPLTVDLSTEAGIETLLARVAALEIDLLVNNAGLAAYGPFTATLAGRELEIVRVNVEAIVAVTRRILPAMLERGTGGIINVSSQMAFQPMPYFATYAASKAFVLSFSEALAVELRGTGVRVTAVAPGFINTEFAAVANSQALEHRLPHLNPDRVVMAALRAHDRGRTVKIVGVFYAFLTIVGRFVPRVALRRAMGKVMQPVPMPPSSNSRAKPPT
jgi:short-subunit dehydrogenase